MRNPYVNRGIIRDTENFYGRKLEVSRIYSRIGASNPQSVSIVGDRRIGKSSLLRFIWDEKNRNEYLDNPDNYTFVLMDLQEHPQGGIQDFMESLEELISLELGRDMPSHGRTGYDILKRLAMELRREKRKLIILFDEFELITQNPAFDSPFYAFFRGLASNYDIAFITSSMRDLQELCSVKAIANSPFFNIFSKINLGPFTREEAMELIEKPSTAAGLPLGKYREAILDISGMLPLFIQIACSAFFEYIANSGHEPDCSADIRNIEDAFFEEAYPHFQYIWDDIFSRESRDVCRSVLNKEKIDEDKKNILLDLIRRGYVIEKDNSYKIFSSTFASRIISQDTSQNTKSHEEASGERKVEGIMVLDVCKHSSFMQKMGESRMMTMLNQLKSVVYEASANFGCQYISNRGDGYLMTYCNINDTMSAAVSMLKMIKEHNEKIKDDNKIHIRIALNFGETIIGPSGERLGERINETFRIAELRDPASSDGSDVFPQEDYILASERIYNILKNTPEINFKLIGIFPLRDLPDLHKIYEVK